MCHTPADSLHLSQQIGSSIWSTFQTSQPSPSFSNSITRFAIIALTTFQNTFLFFQSCRCWPRRLVTRRLQPIEYSLAVSMDLSFTLYHYIGLSHRFICLERLVHTKCHPSNLYSCLCFLLLSTSLEKPFLSAPMERENAINLIG